MRWRNATTIASSSGVSTVLLGSRGPIRESTVVVRDRHLLTVVRLTHSTLARTLAFSFDAWSSARTRGVVRALP